MVVNFCFNVLMNLLCSVSSDWQSQMMQFLSLIMLYVSHFGGSTRLIRWILLLRLKCNRLVTSAVEIVEI